MQFYCDSSQISGKTPQFQYNTVTLMISQFLALKLPKGIFHTI